MITGSEKAKSHLKSLEEKEKKDEPGIFRKRELAEQAKREAESKLRELRAGRINQESKANSGSWDFPDHRQQTTHLTKMVKKMMRS